MKNQNNLPFVSYEILYIELPKLVFRSVIGLPTKSERLGIEKRYILPNTKLFDENLHSSWGWNKKKYRINISQESFDTKEQAIAYGIKKLKETFPQSEHESTEDIVFVNV